MFTLKSLFLLLFFVAPSLVALAQSKQSFVFWSEKVECGRQSDSVTIKVTCGHVTAENNSTSTVVTDTYEMRITIGTLSRYLLAHVELKNLGSVDIPISIKTWNAAQFETEDHFFSGRPPISRLAAFEAPTHVRLGQVQGMSTVQTSKPELRPGVIRMEERVNKLEWMFRDPLTAKAVKPGKTLAGNIAFHLETKAKYRLIFIEIEGITFVFYSRPA